MLTIAKESHILDVFQNMREDDLREVLATFRSDSKGDLAQSLINAPCVKYAVIHDHRACALMGISPVWPGVGQAWLIGTHEVGSYGVEVAHAAKIVINNHLKSMHRIHAYSAEFHAQAHQWLEMIGFVRESTLKQYGKNGEDFYCYAITRSVP